MSDVGRTIKHKKTVGFISIAVLLFVFVFVGWYVGRPMIKFVSEPEVFRDWIDSKGIMGRFIFVGMTALQVLFAVIPGEPLEIGAGYAFGAVEGTLLTLVGEFLGSLLVFCFVRKFGVRFVELFYPVDKINSLRFLRDPKKLNGLAIILFAIPGTPKDLMVWFLGLTKIKFFVFILTASVARLPSIVTSTVGGNALGMQNYVFAIIMLVATLVLSGIGLLIYNAVCKRHAGKGDDSDV